MYVRTDEEEKDKVVHLNVINKLILQIYYFTFLLFTYREKSCILKPNINPKNKKQILKIIQKLIKDQLFQ